MYKFLQGHIFISLGHIFRSGIVGLCVKYMFNLLKNSQTFPNWLHYFTFPPAVCEGSSFSTPSPTLIIHLVYDRLLSRYEVVLDSNPLFIVKLGYLTFYFLVVIVIYMFWILVPYQIAKFFSYSVGCLFTFLLVSFEATKF